MSTRKKLIILLLVVVVVNVILICGVVLVWRGVWNKAGEEQASVQATVQATVSEENKPRPVYCGTVTDPDGNAIKGAKLYILRRNRAKAVSGQQGEYEMSRTGPKFPESHDIYIIARHEEKNLASATKVESENYTQNITLLPAFTATGSVTDPEGNPIEEATVSFGFFAKSYIISFAENRSFAVDSRGIYRVPFIPPKNRYSVRFHAEGYGIEEIVVNSDDAVDGVLKLDPVVLLKADQTISGVVVSSDGKPVPNVRIFHRGDHQTLGYKTQTQTADLPLLYAKVMLF